MHEQRGRINTRLNPKRNIFCHDPTYRTWKSVETSAKQMSFWSLQVLCCFMFPFWKRTAANNTSLSSRRYVQPLSLSLDDEFRLLTSGKHILDTRLGQNRTIVYIIYIIRHISEGLCRTMCVYTYTKYCKHKVYYVYSNTYIWQCTV